MYKRSSAEAWEILSAPDVPHLFVMFEYCLEALVSQYEAQRRPGEPQVSPGESYII